MMLDTLKKASIQALKDRDTVARSVLSLLLNKVKNVEIEKRSKGQELSDADVVSVLQKTKKELEEERLAFHTHSTKANQMLSNAAKAQVRESNTTACLRLKMPLESQSSKPQTISIYPF